MSSRHEEISQAIQAIWDGEAVPKDTLERFFGQPMDDQGYEIAVGQVKFLSSAGLERATEMVLGFIEAMAGSDAGLKQGLGIDEHVSTLVDNLDDYDAMPLDIRRGFGLLSEKHLVVLAEAIKSGGLDKGELSKFWNDGQALTKRLGAAASVPFALKFATASLESGDDSGRLFEEVQIAQVVTYRQPRAQFKALIRNEFALAALAHDEPDTLEWLERTVDDDTVFWDVGANIGKYSLYALSLAAKARCVLFEPAPGNYELITLNVALNDYGDRAVAFMAAADEKTRIGTFSNSVLMGGSWFQEGLAGQSFQGDRAYQTGCYISSVDDFVRDADCVSPPTHLKIDVDGPELRVLRGAAATLKRDSLRHVLVEMRNDEEVKVMDEVIHSAGFVLVSPEITGFGNRIYSRDKNLKLETRDPRGTAPQNP